ncbi:glycosyltransferase [Cohnella terricola]|uniref:Glycosyltransferase n=1 Tax=Cohnella terricola TaxID=1289167 RepID=A0A559JTE1_9BACL|nr:glycosyltransferase [Cohnella terricola]TVY03149.1 glycosyltransferase [Cohnella terricola]
MKISIVLYAQHYRLAVQCLDRIQQFTSIPYELLIVADDGLDDVINFLTFEYEHRVIRNEGKSVASAYNLGAAASSGERIVFLRDQIMVSEGWLEALSGCLDKHPNAAIAGPMMNDVSGEQRISVLFKNKEHLYQSAPILRLNKSDVYTRVPRLISLLMMIPRECYDRIGGFDERFEIETYEDDDLCYRALMLNYDLYIAEGSVVFWLEPPPMDPNDPVDLATVRRCAVGAFGSR